MKEIMGICIPHKPKNYKKLRDLSRREGRRFGNRKRIERKRQRRCMRAQLRTRFAHGMYEYERHAGIYFT